MSKTQEKENTITTSQILKYHWRQAMKFPKLVAVNFIVTPISVVLDKYIAPLIVAALLMGIQNNSIALGSSWWMIVVYAGLQISSQVIGYRLNLWAMWGVQVEGGRQIYHNAYKKLSEQSMSFYNNNFAGSLVSRVNKFASAYMAFWNSVVFEVAFVVVVIIATLVGVGILMWQYAIVLALLIMLYAVVAYFGTKFMRVRQKIRSKSYTEISARLSDSISNMFAVKIDSRERSEQKRLDESVDIMSVREYAVRRGYLAISSVYTSIGTTMRVVVLVMSIWAVEQGFANTASIYLVITYTFNVIDELRNIVQVFRSLYQITGDSEEMLELLQEPIDVKDTTDKRLKVNRGEITLDNVTFQHKDGNKPVLEDFSLVIPAGQRVGIVGVSGAGKTTLTKLLMRFVDPNRGSVQVDGVDVSQVTQASLHDAIAYVPQEPLLFHRSILENIGYSRSDATDSQIKQAAKQAHADEFIKDLADGYKTVVGERGVKLSGGQRQRVAIARAILKDAPILILDEATSALDSESEKFIQDALTRLMKGKTSVVIAHRLSTISSLDRIIVLDKGKIVEDGSHSELLKKHGVYAKLWSRQSGGFIEE